ncbi:peptidylprolyl isomerase [Sutterella sp.]|uniref:peptidylprolyl isomerase n=1 Tax=Sutterella sp. TaxID=1981025 RepID=UPI0026DFEC16|nr:peptidylprolyl isomerase [Sutterella sp.]MDO5531609.1 peptidylprolyl isomerase [Sutterella sp.]
MADYAEKHPATDKEVREAYDNLKAQYGDTEYQVRNILVKTEAEAKAVIQRLNKGEDFAKLAGELSIDPETKTKGGLFGWLSTMRLDPAIANTIRVLAPNSVAQAPIRNQHGYHVIKLDAKRAAQNFPAFDSRKDSLKKELSALNARKHFAELVQEAKIVNGK